MSDDTQRETYFENMSRAYAQICELFATLITPDVNNIPTTGIWARIEQPELERILFFDPPLKRVDTVSLSPRFIYILSCSPSSNLGLNELVVPYTDSES